MTANIMKANREFMHLSTCCGLEEDWKSNQVHISLRKVFDKVSLEDTPLYDMYEDYTTDAEGGL